MAECCTKQHTTSLKKGDSVVIIAGGNNKTRPLKGKIGKVLRFVGKDRVIVEGLNIVTRHRRAMGPNKPGGKERKEAPIHISNVMYYVEKAKKGVRLKNRVLADGSKVRGYMNRETKKFEQID